MTCNGGGCVAIDATAEDGTVYLSSTRRPEAKPLAIDADEWPAFLADVKAGRYGGDDELAQAQYSAMQLCESLAATAAREEELLRQRAAVLALHKPDGGNEVRAYDCCLTCEDLWPCPTAKALGVRL